MARELNQPFPSLVIGLGGSGAATLAHLRQQLLDVYQNTFPETVETLVLDTTTTPLSQFASAANVRQEGAGVGAVTMEGLDFAYIGGDARSMVQGVRDGKYPYMANWLDADHYLNRAPHLLKLDDGAGQYRQLGRLAMFQDVASTANSQFYRRATAKINAMKTRLSKLSLDSEMRSLAVYFVGSLAGGTGAGLFIDAAYLMRKIAAASGVTIKTTGFFFLPESFESTLSQDQVQDARARSFAALRELGRSLVQEFDKEIGFPITYHPATSGDDPRIWRAELKDERLYDSLYLIDGRRGVRPLNTVPMREGITSSIADSILAYMNSKAGKYLLDKVANVTRKIDERRSREGDLPYVGTLGTFTMRLPINQIIEGWAYQLGLDIAKTLFPASPQSIDRMTGLPTELATNENHESARHPAQAVEDLLTSTLPVINPRKTEQAVYPSNLWTRLYQWYTYSTNSEDALFADLLNKSAQDWVNIITPSDRDTQTMMDYRQTQTILNRTVSNTVRPSDEIKGEEISDGAKRIVGKTEDLFNNHLGQYRSNGTRDGGLLREKLKEISRLQIQRFREACEILILVHLNGQPENEGAKAKGGKLAWTLALFNTLHDVLSTVRQGFYNIRTNASAVGTRRSAAINTMNASRDEMVEKRNNYSVMRLVARPEALKAQDAFLSSADNVFNLFRAEIAREIVEDVINEMIDYTKRIIEQLRQWTGILATQTDSLYHRVIRGKEQVINERERADNIASRDIIRDGAWEDTTYRRYIGGNDSRPDAITDLLGRFEWEARMGQDAMGKPTLQIGLKANNVPLRSDSDGQWSNHNLRVFMDYCRERFKEAYQNESILGYLAKASPYRDNPQAIANKIFENAGALLQYDATQAGAIVKSYLLLAYNDGSPEEVRFLNEVESRLKERFGFAVTDETQSGRQPSDDPFRLMFVSTAEAIPMRIVQSYRDGLATYQQVSASSRPRLHVLPAEVQVSRLEVGFSKPSFELNQVSRPVAERVAMLLEHPERFREFLSLYAHNVIRVTRDPENQKETHFVFVLTTPSMNKAKPDQLEEWWLSRPASSASMVEAMMTYIFRRQDYGLKVHRGESYVKPFNDKHIIDFLVTKRKADSDRRLESGDIGLYHPEIRTFLEEAYNNGNETLFNRLVPISVEYDIMEERIELMKTEIKELKIRLDDYQAGNIDRDKERYFQELYDLYSVAVIVYREMCQQRYHDALRAVDKPISAADDLWA